MMDDIFDAWDETTGNGRDEQTTRALSDQYVAQHAEEFVGWEALSQEMLVKEIDAARERNDEQTVRKVQVWLWHRFEPQQIGVVDMRPKVRQVNG